MWLIFDDFGSDALFFGRWLLCATADNFGKYFDQLLAVLLFLFDLLDEFDGTVL